MRSNANGVFSLRLCRDHVGDLFSRFKLFLEPHALRDSSNVDPRLPSLPVSSTFSGSFPMLILSDRAASVLSISSSTSCPVSGTTQSSRSPAKLAPSPTSVCASPSVGSPFACSHYSRSIVTFRFRGCMAHRTCRLGCYRVPDDARRCNFRRTCPLCQGWRSRLERSSADHYVNRQLPCSGIVSNGRCPIQ